MNGTTSRRPAWATVAAVVAVVFGALTIFSGGRALFGGAAARAAVGDAVPFVLWFNFLAGFLYVLAGAGLFFWRRWSAQLALFIALSTIIVSIAFAWHAVTGNPYEVRTAGALLLRSGIWIAIALAACRALGCGSVRPTVDS